MDPASTGHTDQTSDRRQRPPQPDTPALCSAGCGFYGTAENKGLCSNCYTAYLKDLIAKTEPAIVHKREPNIDKPADVVKPEITNNPSPVLPNSETETAVVHKRELEIDKPADFVKPEITNNPSPDQAEKKRCGMCDKRVGLLLVGFACRCGVTYCKVHRYPEDHRCLFDFKKAGKDAIRKENPVCRSDKIVNRV